MKRKNLILAIAAFVIGIGTSFGTFLSPETVYVRAKLTNADDAPIVCQETEADCDNTGAFNCTVSVTVSTGPGTAQTGTSISPFDVGCVHELKNTSADIVPSGVSVYRLVLNSETE